MIEAIEWMWSLSPAQNDAVLLAAELACLVCLFVLFALVKPD